MQSVYDIYVTEKLRQTVGRARLNREGFVDRIVVETAAPIPDFSDRPEVIRYDPWDALLADSIDNIKDWVTRVEAEKKNNRRKTYHRNRRWDLISDANAVLPPLKRQSSIGEGLLHHRGAFARALGAIVCGFLSIRHRVERKTSSAGVQTCPGTCDFFQKFKNSSSYACWTGARSS